MQFITEKTIHQTKLLFALITLGKTVLTIYAGYRTNFTTHRRVKRRLNKNAIPIILPHENPIVQQESVKYEERF